MRLVPFAFAALAAAAFVSPAAAQTVVKHANTPCLEGAYGEAPRRLCNEPDEYVYWDLYHPSVSARSQARGLGATQS